MFVMHVSDLFPFRGLFSDSYNTATLFFRLRRTPASCSPLNVKIKRGKCGRIRLCSGRETASGQLAKFHLHLRAYRYQVAKCRSFRKTRKKKKGKKRNNEAGLIGSDDFSKKYCESLNWANLSQEYFVRLDFAEIRDECRANK